MDRAQPLARISGDARDLSDARTRVAWRQSTDALRLNVKKRASCRHCRLSGWGAHVRDGTSLIQL